MWTPTTALLWESWRLSRRLMGILVVIATLGGAALLGSGMSRDQSAPFVVLLAGFAAWLGQVRLAVPDHRKGFALTLGYTRPIATWTLVAVPLAFVAVSAAVIYLLPVVVLRGVFGVVLPLLPMAALCATASVVWVASQWWTADPGVRRVFGIAIVLVLTQIVFRPTADNLSRIASISSGAYVRMAVLSAVALLVSTIGVARQRRGDDRLVFGWRRALRSGAHASRGPVAWISDRVGLRCPVSSATLAQLWFEVQTLGGRIAKSGVVLGFSAAVFLPLVSAAGVATEALVSYMFLSLVIPLFVALPSILGLRRKPGHVFMDDFAGTLPLGTARLVGLKVLVAALALFIAWGIIAACLWIVVHWLDGSNPNLRRIIADYRPDLPGGVAGMGAVALVAVNAIALVAIAAALHALLVLNAKRFLLRALGIALYGTAMVVLVVRGWLGLDGELIFVLHLWGVSGAFLLGICLLLWRGLVERLFSARAVVVVVASGLALPIAWTISAWPNTVGDVDELLVGLLFSLLPLTAVALLPWSFSRLRHR